MRSMVIEHNKKKHTLAATFAASIEIADKVGDPLLIAREAAVEAAMLSAGMPYSPKFNFTVENVPEIIRIGLSAAGEDMSIEDVQELVFAKGLIHSKIWAADYIALIVEPRPKFEGQGPETGAEKKKPGKPKARRAGANV